MNFIEIVHLELFGLGCSENYNTLCYFQSGGYPVSFRSCNRHASLSRLGILDRYDGLHRLQRLHLQRIGTAAQDRSELDAQLTLLSFLCSCTLLQQLSIVSPEFRNIS